MKKNSAKQLLGLMVLVLTSQVEAATVNIGAVASTSTTGQFLSASTTINTVGLVKVGFFSKTSAELAAIVTGWTGATSAYDRYNSLNSFFTQIGTAVAPATTGGTLGGSTTGLYNTAGSGWNFSSAGGIAGTASYVDLALAPQNTVMYIWAFNNTDFSASTFNPTQWALVTNQGATSTWKIPGSGTLSMQLANVTQASDVILGNDTGNSVNMVAIPEPSSLSLVALGLIGVSFLRRKK